MKIAEMKAKRDALKADASAILDEIETNGGFDADASVDLVAEYEAKKDEIAQIDGTINRAERLSEERRNMRPTASARPALSLGTNEPDPATTAGFKSLAEFASAVRQEVTGTGYDGRLHAAPTNVHERGGSAGEGFLVPTEYRDAIWNAVTEQDDFLSRFTLTPTSAASVEYVKDETTPWGSAGIQANWRGEGTAMTPDKLRLKAGRLEVDQLYVLAAVSDEMLADAPRVESHLTQKAAQAIAYKAGEAVVNGNGAGQPLGFLTSAAKVEVAKESGQTASTIVPANVNKAYSRRLMTQGSQPFWMANMDIFEQLQSMGFGTDTPLFYPPTGIAGAPNGTLLGLPVVYTEHAQTLGTAGDLVLVDPAGYFAAVRGGGVQFAASMHLWFDYAVSAFRWTFRMGGTPILSAPVSPDKGSATKSHFVSIATRA